MAAALIVPVGAVVATSAGAASNPNHATCSGTSGKLTSTTQNGQTGNGILLAKKQPQQYKASANGTCTGGVVTTYHLAGVVSTKTAVNCQTLHTTSLGGSGTFTWETGMGASTANLHFVWTGNTSISFTGDVVATNSSTNVFKGQHIVGSITTHTSLASAASGGQCSSTQELKQFTIATLSFHL